jgi:hypothetical protein
MDAKFSGVHGETLSRARTYPPSSFPSAAFSPTQTGVEMSFLHSRPPSAPSRPASVDPEHGTVAQRWRPSCPINKTDRAVVRLQHNRGRAARLCAYRVASSGPVRRRLEVELGGVPMWTA